MRWPGIEPGSTAWKATMLTFTPPTQLEERSYFKAYKQNSTHVNAICAFHNRKALVIMLGVIQNIYNPPYLHTCGIENVTNFKLYSTCKAHCLLCLHCNHWCFRHYISARSGMILLDPAIQHKSDNIQVLHIRC